MAMSNFQVDYYTHWSNESGLSQHPGENDSLALEENSTQKDDKLAFPLTDNIQEYVGNILNSQQASDNTLNSQQLGDNILNSQQPGDNILNNPQPGDNLQSIQESRDNILHIQRLGDNTTGPASPAERLKQNISAETMDGFHGDYNSPVEDYQNAQSNNESQGK
jgi:hypothetical protein